MATDPSLAEAWRVAQELWSASSRDAAATRPARIWNRSWLAAAAVVLVSVGVGLYVQRSTSRDDTFRSTDRYAVESLVQSDAALPRDAFRLRWNAGPPDARYQVRVT